jgi:hypothetical protein
VIRAVTAAALIACVAISCGGKQSAGGITDCLLGFPGQAIRARIVEPENCASATARFSRLTHNKWVARPMPAGARKQCDVGSPDGRWSVIVYDVPGSLLGDHLCIALVEGQHWAG